MLCKPKLSKNQKLRELLNDAKSKQGNNNPVHFGVNPSVSFYAPILDKISFWCFKQKCQLSQIYQEELYQFTQNHDIDIMKFVELFPN